MLHLFLNWIWWMYLKPFFTGRVKGSPWMAKRSDYWLRYRRDYMGWCQTGLCRNCRSQWHKNSIHSSRQSSTSYICHNNIWRLYLLDWLGIQERRESWQEYRKWETQSDAHHSPSNVNSGLFCKLSSSLLTRHTVNHCLLLCIVWIWCAVLTNWAMELDCRKMKRVTCPIVFSVVICYFLIIPPQVRS